MAFDMAEADLAGQIRALLLMEPAAQIFGERLWISPAETVAAAGLNSREPSRMAFCMLMPPGVIDWLARE